MSDPILSPLPILTVRNDPLEVLRTKATPFDFEQNGWEEAEAMIAAMRATLVMPAAGLAAPQLGFGKRLFLYSWDRSTENLTAVINPRYTPLSAASSCDWEMCFSAIFDDGSVDIAYVPRFESIHVHYWNEAKEKVTQTLEGYAARVFQHEYDHLEGIVMVRRDDATLRSFQSKDAARAFVMEERQKQAEAAAMRKAEGAHG
jgi:peptide deformylase